VNARADAFLDDAATPPDTPLELRVLEGAQRGAQAAVAWRSFEIGGVAAGAGCEVQLRDDAIGESRVRVTPRGTSAARLEVLAGEVMLGTQCLAAGSASDWRLYAPLRIGATLLAMGEPGHAAWQLPAAAHVPRDAPAGPDAAADAACSPAPARAGGAHRTERRLAVGGAALVAIAAMLLVMTHLLAVRPGAPVDRRQLVARLLASQPSWQGLRADAGPAGAVVRGEVATNAQRESLQRTLAQAGLADVPVEVVTGEQVVDAVADVYRVQGVAARAQWDGGGQVTVQAHEADAAALARAGQTARRDVAGLRELVVRNEPPAPAPQDRPVADDPGKRVAAIVPGDSPYVATADGTRYFIGALLPTGHRVEAIEPHRVVLSRDGRESELDF
jgi:type III secretion protein D